MEYCDSLECDSFYSKKIVRIVVGCLTAAVLAVAFEELPELRSADQYALYAGIQGQTADYRELSQDDSTVLKQEKLASMSIGNAESLQRNLREIIQLESGSGQVIEAVSGLPTAPAPSVYGESLPELDSLPVSDIPDISQVPQESEFQEPDTAAGKPVMPDTSLNEEGVQPEHIVPDTSVEIVPDYPVPDVPGYPADQEEPEEPDVSGEVNSPVIHELQGFLVDEAGIIYGYDPSAGLSSTGVLTLPTKGCTGIAKGAFDGVGAGIYEIYIPQNITYIEPGALNDLFDLEWIELEEQNSAYECFEGILYDSTMTTIAAFPPARTGQYSIPGFTTGLGDYSFAGTQLSKLDMRNCGLVEVGDKVFGDLDVNGVKVAAPRQYIEEYREAFGKTGILVE